MSKQLKLSVIIPTKNEAVFLPTCLKSVAFADEIVVLDSGSTDGTLVLSKKLGARVVEYQWQGYRYAHELGFKEAKGEWLLYVDADERISLELAESIYLALQKPKYDAYQVNRLNFIMGKPLRHGGWYPDPVTRLIRKEALIEWVGELHEYPKIEGEIGALNGDLYHLTHRGLDWSLQKTREYTRKMAEIYYQAGHPSVTVKNFFGAMAREFWFRTIKKQGWRDGLIGWYEIWYQTFNAFLIQVQLWELQQNHDWAQVYAQIDAQISQELDQKTS